MQKSVDWVEFTINEAEGSTPGLTELELYEEEDTASMIHILADGNFAYDWTVWPGEKPKISAWTYGSDDDVSWEMNGSPSSIGQIQEELNRLKKPITICAFLTEHPDIWDEAVLLRALPLLSALYVSIRNWIVGKIHLKGSARNLSIMHSVKKLKKKEQRNKRSKILPASFRWRFSLISIFAYKSIQKLHFKLSRTLDCHSTFI